MIVTKRAEITLTYGNRTHTGYAHSDNVNIEALNLFIINIDAELRSAPHENA